MTGMQNGERSEQLRHFSEKLAAYSRSGIPLKIPETWSEAFDQLRIHLESYKGKHKQVVFFDEIPWLSTHRSGFLEALDYFWNDWASTANIVVVICGSAASWMLENIVQNKGGLHNRITQLIRLKPFTLKETKTYLSAQGVQLDLYQICLIYMAMGGIPHYLQGIKPGESAYQNINRLCFEKDGLLRHEFQNLYKALFDYADNHIEIIKALSKKWKGLTRNEIIKTTKFTNGGGLTKILTELEESSFISVNAPFGKKKKDSLYRLSDEYSMFYLHYIEKSTSTEKDAWLAVTKSASYLAWSGYAFESLCIKHTLEIKKALGISGVFTEISSFYKPGNKEKQGYQIDVLIERDDRCINLCEMKFYNSEYTITKDYAQKIRRKKTGFAETTKTKKHIFITLVTTYGLLKNEQSLGLIDQVITLKDLF